MDNVTFVADIGSGSIKAEVAGADAPRIIENVVGIPKHKRIMPSLSASDASLLTGKDIERRGLFKLSNPMFHGHVRDARGFQLVLKQAVAQTGVEFRDHPFLLTEAPNVNRHQRSEMAQFIFEECQVPALLFAVQGVLSLYASGATTGLVLDIGEGVTQTSPVVDYYSLRDCARRVDFAGQDVTLFLQNMLRQSGCFLDTSAECSIVRDIKEMHCKVSSTVRRTDDGNKSSQVRHMLPDGHEIALSNDAMYAPDLLFAPSLGGYEHPGLTAIVHETIRRCDLDVRQSLYQGIFVAGGTTLTEKLNERLISELAKDTPKNCRLKLHAPEGRRFTAWTGASFLAQLDSFKSLATKRSEWEEHGERILNARLFA